MHLSQYCSSSYQRRASWRASRCGWRVLWIEKFLALLFAVQKIDPTRLPRKTYFVWSVREEGGLNGARAFGAEHGRELNRVYSIDTFVSSDTPLESPHFAYLPLGKGAVLRGLDNGALTPPAERERILAIARAQQIPIQVGTTMGSTDGSALTAFGPVNTSWIREYPSAPTSTAPKPSRSSSRSLISPAMGSTISWRACPAPLARAPSAGTIG